MILLFSLLISAFAVVPQAASADALPFVDVKAGDWFYGAVGRVYKEGIIIGITVLRVIGKDVAVHFIQKFEKLAVR